MSRQGNKVVALRSSASTALQLCKEHFDFLASQNVAGRFQYGLGRARLDMLRGFFLSKISESQVEGEIN